MKQTKITSLILYLIKHHLLDLQTSPSYLMVGGCFFEISKCFQCIFFAKNGRRRVALAKFEQYPSTFLMMILWWSLIKEANFRKVIIRAIKKGHDSSPIYIFYKKNDICHEVQSVL